MDLPKLDFISLRLRVSLGFIFICIILIVGGLFSYLGFSRSKDLFLKLTSINEQAKLHSNMEKDVLELQGRVQQFVRQGRKFTEDKVYSLSKTLMEDLKIAHKSAEENTAKNIITNTIEHFNRYLHAFGQVVEERELRTLLVEDKLIEDVERSEESILKYIKLEEEEGEVDHISKAYIIINTLLKIEKHTFTYFNTLDSTLVTETKRLFNNIKSSMGELIEEEKKREGEEEKILLLQKTQLLFSKYENGWFRAVQATRGYLYLVNVVLAGEASEILHNTKRLKKISADDLDIVHKQSSLLIQRYIYFTIIITIAAVTIGIITSWLIAHSVITPINSLTKVFKLLAKGDHSSEIPGRDFKDEIGDLSRAAEVFKNKNIQTELLLNESQTLTRELESNRKELARSNDELEKANEGLVIEVNSRKHAEDAFARQFQLNKTITDNAASCLFMMDKEGHSTFMNPAAETVTGYTLDEIRDMSLHDAIHHHHPDGRPYPMCDCPIENAQAELVEMEDYEDIFVCKDGSFFPVICHIAPLEENGKVVGSVLEFRDVTKQKKMEEELRKHHDHLQELVNERTAEITEANEKLRDEVAERKKAEDQIKASLKEKEVLLKEIHHRVKNNMQIMASLLRLQSEGIKDKHLLGLFEESRNRIKSMALIHEDLYSGKDLGRIDFDQYTRKLTGRLMKSFGVDSSRIITSVKIDNVFLGVDTAIPCGLIINELFTNSLKYAFPVDKFGVSLKDKKGEIRIDCHSNSAEHTLVFSDNGVGLPEDIDIQETETMGLDLVRSLTRQLGGTIELNRNDGTEFTIIFRT